MPMLWKSGAYLPDSSSLMGTVAALAAVGQGEQDDFFEYYKHKHNDNS